MGAAVLPDAATFGVSKRYPFVPRRPFILGITSTLPRRIRCACITELMWYFAEDLVLFSPLPTYVQITKSLS